MAEERSRPDWVGRHRALGIEDLDRYAQAEIRAGRIVNGAGLWIAKQVVSQGASSWGGLALEGGLALAGPVLKTLGGTRVVAKGVSRVLFANYSEAALQQAVKAGEVVIAGSDKARRVVTAFGGVLRPDPGRGIKYAQTAIKHAHSALHALEYGKAPFEVFHKAHNISVQNAADDARRRRDRAANAQGSRLGPVSVAQVVRKAERSRPIAGVSIGPLGSLNRMSQPQMSSALEREVMRKGIFVPGAWGTAVRNPSAASLNRMRQPALSAAAEREIMTKGIFVPGVWGTVVNRSRPGGLREMGHRLRGY